jgi:ABC-type antimicrobial peptide transport system permease subunit
MVGITSSFVFFIHFMVDTKNIAYTILPTVIVALLFALYTTKKIIEEER